VHVSLLSHVHVIRAGTGSRATLLITDHFHNLPAVTTVHQKVL